MDIAEKLDFQLNFEAEEEAEKFFDRAKSKLEARAFVVQLDSPPINSDSEEEGWSFDVSPVQIVGDGIDTGVARPVEHHVNNDFLKVRNRGRRSYKHAVILEGTRLSIDPLICKKFSRKILAKGRYHYEELEEFSILCEGNGNSIELSLNLDRNLQSAGLDLEVPLPEFDLGLWDHRSDITSGDLAESIEASLTRDTQLPGTHRFVLDISVESRLFSPILKAKHEIHLIILSYDQAAKCILDMKDSNRNRSRDAVSVSLRTMVPSVPDHIDDKELKKSLAAADLIHLWRISGRRLDGKKLREALAAIGDLELTLAFYKELVKSMELDSDNRAQVKCLQRAIFNYETAIEQIIIEYLPFARRFASRHTLDGEDLEDVFQIAFMGLQRAALRFDPERGTRFAVYCTFWMRQAINRWRSDEGSSIRVPAHMCENIAKLDRALDLLDGRTGCSISDNDLAAELNCTADEVRQFRSIPREAVYPESIGDWDDLLPESEEENAIDQAETEKIVEEVLAELKDRQADVIRMRFGIGREAPMTLEEIGQFYGVTRERIRQIEVKALGRLSHPERKLRIHQMLGI